jgi:DNA polymerase I-like protein with 3'-5' exonuclease and polymerase domains
MQKNTQNLTGLVQEAKIYASIETKHQKLMANLEKNGIKLSDKPIEEIEKNLLANMQKLGMDLSKHSSVREMAEHYGLLVEKK